MSANVIRIEEVWLRQFRAAVDDIGQAAMAERLGCSPTLINQIYHNKYPSPLEKWRDRFLAQFSPGLVGCPVLGEISREKCGFHRRREFAATNPERVRLFKACRSCPNNPDREDAS